MHIINTWFIFLCIYIIKAEALLCIGWGRIILDLKKFTFDDLEKSINQLKTEEIYQSGGCKVQLYKVLSHLSIWFGTDADSVINLNDGDVYASVKVRFFENR